MLVKLVFTSTLQRKSVYFKMLLVVLLSSIIIAKAANINMLNNWLHHEMEPLELNHHFGVDSPAKVNPQFYQVIQIYIDSDKIRQPDHTDLGKLFDRDSQSKVGNFKTFSATFSEMVQFSHN